VGDFIVGGSQICSASRLLTGYCSHQVTIGREGPLYNCLLGRTGVVGCDRSGRRKREDGEVGQCCE